MRTRLPAFGVLLAVLATWTCTLTPSQPDGGFEEARQRVLAEVVRPDSLDRPVIVFGLREPLQPGDEIRPYPMEGYEPVPAATTMEAETWFFWIDDAPGAYFVHPNRFIFVPVSGGEMTVQEQEWWPELNGEGLWIDRDEYWDPEVWAWSNLNVPSDEEVRRRSRSGLAAAARTHWGQESGQQVALVINGSQSGQPLADEMAHDTSSMHDMLSDSGFQVTYLGPAGSVEPNQDGIAEGGNWIPWFSQQGRNLKPGDTLLVYVVGHGWEADNGNGRAGPIDERNLSYELEKINPGVNIVVIIQACESGAFRDGMQKLADATLTSTSNLDPSWSDLDPPFFVFWLKDDPNPADEGSEYTSGFIEDWREVMADPAQRETAQARASAANTGFFVEVSALAHISAVEKDVMAISGYAFPTLTRGLPPTRPVALQDASGDGVACGTTEVAQGLNPAADLGSVEGFTEGSQPGFLLTFPGVTSIASAVSALPPGEWGMTIHLNHPGLSVPALDPARPFASLENEVFRVQFSPTAQTFQIQAANFTEQGWVGVSSLGSGVIPIGPTLKVILPGRVLDDRPTFYVDAFAEEVCDNVPADPTGERPQLFGEAVSTGVAFDWVGYFGLRMLSTSDSVGDALDCTTGAAVEGLPPEADITGLEVFADDTTTVLVLRFPEGVEPAAAAADSSRPVRFGVSVLDPQGILPTFDPNAVFATTQNIYHRIEFNAETQGYAISIQELGPSNWLAVPSLGSGALAAGGTLQIALPRDGLPPGANFYLAGFLDTGDGCVADTVGYEEGVPALSIP